MSPEEFSRRIYCSVAEVISFDPVAGLLSIQGSVTDSGSTKTIQITAGDVTHFHWNGVVKDPEGGGAWFQDSFEGPVPSKTS